jgi:hypothetical protein
MLCPAPRLHTIGAEEAVASADHAHRLERQRLVAAACGVASVKELDARMVVPKPNEASPQTDEVYRHSMS